jgi:hypothetical protein
MTRLNAEIIISNGTNSRMKAFVEDAESCIIIDCDENGITDIRCKSEEVPIFWKKESRGFLGCRIRGDFTPDDPSLEYVANVFYNAFLMNPGSKEPVIEWLQRWNADFSVFDDLRYPSPDAPWAF